MLLAVLLETMERIAALAICLCPRRHAEAVVVAETVRHCLDDLAVAVAVLVDSLDKQQEPEQQDRAATAGLQVRMRHPFAERAVVVQHRPEPMATPVLVRAAMVMPSAMAIHSLVVAAVAQRQAEEHHLAVLAVVVMEAVPLRQLAAMAEHICSAVRPLVLVVAAEVQDARVAERPLQLAEPEQLAL